MSQSGRSTATTLKLRNPANLQQTAGIVSLLRIRLDQNISVVVDS
jgi:hypothetical protein